MSSNDSAFSGSGSLSENITFNMHGLDAVPKNIDTPLHDPTHANTKSCRVATQNQNASQSWKFVICWSRLSWRCGKVGPLASKHYISPAIWLTFFLITPLIYSTKQAIQERHVFRLLRKLENIESTDDPLHVSRISARVKNTSCAFDMHSTDIRTAHKITMQQTDEQNSVR